MACSGNTSLGYSCSYAIELWALYSCEIQSWSLKKPQPPTKQFYKLFLSYAASKPQTASQPSNTTERMLHCGTNRNMLLLQAMSG